MDDTSHQSATPSPTVTPPSQAPNPESRQEYLDSLVVPTKEEIAKIAEVQAEKEAEQKRSRRERERQAVAASEADSSSQHARSSRLSFGHFSKVSEDGLRAKAATAIQRTYRGYRVRREMKGLAIDASTRWVHAVREAQWRHMTTPRARAVLAGDRWGSSAPSMARQNWKKASAIARHAGNDLDAESSSSPSSSSSSDSESNEPEETEEQKKQRKQEAKERRRQEAKTMGLQYFLEMVDLKHRYGSNLRTYHEEWKRADTHENFFYWLDYGDGRNVDVAACPRERLDSEQVRYLSRDERQYYLVKVDQEGRLCWAKNGVRIDTSEKYKDSIHGIVPSDDPTPAYAPLNETATDTDMSSRPSSSSSNASLSSVNTNHDEPSGTSKGKKSHHLSAATVINKLLRKTVRKNTWIFVADTSFRLYVGIKNSGAFQHSSFLQGSRISAAGLIRIRAGRLTSLSPLSGHYRPPTSNFRAFVRALREAGVDMHHVSVSKSYAVLVGLEVYVKARRRAKGVVGRVKRGVGREGHGKGGGHHGKRGEGEDVDGDGNGEGRSKWGDGEEGDGVVTKVDGGEGEKMGGGKGMVPQQQQDGLVSGSITQLTPVLEEAGELGGAEQNTQRQLTEKEKEEEKMREQNKLTVKILQKLDLGTGMREPKGQKGE